MGLKLTTGEYFGFLFKTVISDNGSEFAKNLRASKKNIKTVYLTPLYFSWSHGTKEKHNGFIQRFITKITRMLDVSMFTVCQVQIR